MVKKAKRSFLRISLSVVEPEQSVSYYENIDQLLKVFIQHPFIFNSSESLELLCNFLKQHIMELGWFLLQYSFEFIFVLDFFSTDTHSNDRSMCTVHHRIEQQEYDQVSRRPSLIRRRSFFGYFSLLETELSSYLTLHPPIAKRALYCICALHPEKKDELLKKIVDVRKRLFICFLQFGIFLGNSI